MGQSLVVQYSTPWAGVKPSPSGPSCGLRSEVLRTTIVRIPVCIQGKFRSDRGGKSFHFSSELRDVCRAGPRVCPCVCQYPASSQPSRISGTPIDYLSTLPLVRISRSLLCVVSNGRLHLSHSSEEHVRPRSEVRTLLCLPILRGEVSQRILLRREGM